MVEAGDGAGTAAVRAFLIADIRGYTTFTRERGDEEAARLARRFAELARDAVAEGGGRVVELRGDEALCVFDSPRQALRTAVAMQQRFADAIREDPSLPLRVGIGLDAGEAVSVEGGYRGSALNLAARLSSLARPGEVLAGDGIMLMAGQVDGLSYSERGRERVKGFRDPVRVHRLEFELDLPAETVTNRGRDRARWWLAAGAAAVCVAGAVAAFLLLRNDGEARGVAADSAALIDPDSGHVEQEVAVGATPIEVVSNSDAAWTLDADAQTISRVPTTGGRALTKAAGVAATSLALGRGLLWAAYADRGPSGTRVGVAALDPSTLTVRGQRLLPGLGPSFADTPTVLYARGAVWVAGPNDLLRKIDPVSRRVLGSIHLRDPPTDLAFGLGSVWATVGGRQVVRIDPSALRITQRISLSTPDVATLAVGASSVWAGDVLTGQVWRIEPGPPLQSHTIKAGLAAAGLTYGDGAVWVASPVEGSVVRIDAQTEKVQSFELGNAPVAVSVAPAGVWSAVTAGGGRTIEAAPKLEGLETLPPGTCGSAVYGGNRRPDFLVVADLPMQRLDAPVTLAMVQAIEFVLRQRGFRAGKYNVAFQACDDATVPAASFTGDKCAANAKLYAATSSVVGVIGPENSGCAISQLAITNRARPGPLPIVSPSASYVGLTRKGAGVSPGDPDRFFPTGSRNFARVYPPDDMQAAADAVLAKRLGVRRPYVFLGSPEDGYAATLAYSFATAARRLGLRPTGPESPPTRAFGALARRLRRAGVDGIFVGSSNDGRAGEFIRTMRRELGPKLVLIAPDAFLPAATQVSNIGSEAVGMYVSGAVVTDPARQLPETGREFTRAFSATQEGRHVDVYVPYAAQAAEVLLAAIARSDGTRASVAHELLRVRLADSILGPFSLDRNGDPKENPIPIFRVERTARTTVFPDDRVLMVIPAPVRLVR